VPRVSQARVLFATHEQVVTRKNAWKGVEIEGINRK